MTAEVVKMDKLIQRGGLRSASVRSLLLWLMLACLLPGMIGASAILYYSFLNERDQLVQDTNQTTRALMQAVDAEFARIQALTQMLATSEHLASNNLAAFHAQALELLPLTKFDHNYLLVDATGQQLVNTLRPYPSKLPLLGNLELVRQVFATGQPAISGVYLGSVRKQHVMALEVPVWQQGRVLYALNFTTVPAAFLGEVLKKQQLPPDWVVSFFDAQGTIAFRSHEANRFIGQKVAPALLALLPGATDGMVEATTLEGIQVSAVYNRSLTSNWGVVIGIPTQSFTAKLYQRFAWLAAGLCLLLAAGFILALTLARRIGGSIRALTAPALALGKGEAVTVPRVYLREAEEVGEAITTASSLLLRAETLRQESESNLSAALHRLDAHLQNSPLAIIEFDPLFRVQRWSVEAERLFGWPESMMLGRAKLNILWVHEEDVEKVHRSWAELSSGVQTQNMCCNRNYRQDGTVVDCEWHNSALYDENGNLTSILSQVLDVSERKRAEAAMRAAMAEAERANNAKSRFLAAASHDLRQPLAALRLYTDALKSKVGAPEQGLVASMDDCIANLSGLLCDLLDLSKLEAGVVKPNIADFSVFELLASLESVYLPKAQTKGLRLCFVPTRVTGRSDPILFKRLLGNFIDNAIRYTTHGGVVVGCRRHQGKTWIEIWDSGIGIAAEHTAQIFEEFKQLGDQARTQGSGLGLTIVAKSAALLGLAFSVRSWPGRGSVFAIELPLGQPEAITLQAAPVVQGRSLCIALVEDNPLFRDAMVYALQDHGHQVVAAATGGALLAELAPWQPDIIVSDYRLGHGETGFDVITAVREALGKDLPAIIITGDTDPKLMASMSGRGIAVLHKPLAMAELEACLEELTVQAS
ncbi:MAG: ATP-binding protein [Azonexus sp.]